MWDTISAENLDGGGGGGIPYLRENYIRDPISAGNLYRGVGSHICKKKKMGVGSHIFRKP